jgi:exopolyphosphatase / guanosine-5'-triphosphate,3'-diphosphate pyrophosphatase
MLDRAGSVVRWGRQLENANVNGLVAALDLGSNSFHLIIARADADDLVAVERLKEKVQLSRGASDGELTRAAIDRGLECIARLAQRLRCVDPARLVVVGTAALREAPNRELFLRPASTLLAHPIRVLDGDEEADLIFLGVSHALAASDARRLIVDIGGGSTEFCVGRSFAPDARASVGVGCVTLTDRCFGGVSLAQGYVAARREALARLAPLAARWRAAKSGSDVYGTSGTIESVRGVLIANGINSTGEISRSGVAALERAIVERRWVSALGVPGLAPERVDIFPAGLAALAACMEALNIDAMEYVDASLQHGLLYDLVARRSPENVQARTIYGWQQRFRVDRAQAQRVRRAALSLLGGVAAEWELDDPAGAALLGWAADLHEIGLVVSPRQPQRHAAYLVENGDMPGFSADARRAIALLIRSQRGGLPMFALGSFGAAGDARMQRLAVLLRLAVILERTRTDADSPAFTAEASADELRLSLDADWQANHALSRRDLEVECERLAALGIRLSCLAPVVAARLQPAR